MIDLMQPFLSIVHFYITPLLFPSRFFKGAGFRISQIPVRLRIHIDEHQPNKDEGLLVDILGPDFERYVGPVVAPDRRSPNPAHPKILYRWSEKLFLLGDPLTHHRPLPPHCRLQ